MPDDEIHELRAAISDLTSRVSNIEQLLANTTTPRIAAPIEAPRLQAERLESRVGLTLINRIGAITLALGVIFFFKYAVDSRWIGASGRVLLGLVGGVAAIGIAEWLWRRNQMVFAQGICGCGLSTIYMSLYAAFAYYHLLPRTAALLAIFVASAGAVLLAFRYRSSALATLGLAVSFVATTLLEDARDGRLIPFVLLLLLSLASVFIAVWRQWLTTLLMTAPVAWICGWMILHGSTAGWLLVYNFVLAAIYFAACRAPSGRPVKTASYVLGHATLLIALFRALYLWALANIADADQFSFLSESVSVLLALYAVAMIVSGVARRSAVDRVIGLGEIGVVVAKLYLYDVWLLTRFYRITAFVLLGILLLTASYVYSRFKNKLDAIWAVSSSERHLK